MYSGVIDRDLREKCPDMELFLVRIFLYSDWIRRDILYLYGVNIRIQSEYRRIRTRNNSVFGHFSRSETTGMKRFKNVLGSFYCFCFFSCFLRVTVEKWNVLVYLKLSRLKIFDLSYVIKLVCAISYKALV